MTISEKKIYPRTGDTQTVFRRGDFRIAAAAMVGLGRKQDKAEYGRNPVGAD